MDNSTILTVNLTRKNILDMIIMIDYMLDSPDVGRKYTKIRDKLYSQLKALEALEYSNNE